MCAAFVSASPGLIGAVVGGLTYFSSAWLSQSAQIKAKCRPDEITRCQRLFSEFNVEASRLYGDALTHEKDDVTDLISLYEVRTACFVHLGTVPIGNLSLRGSALTRS
jgi:hypothetical protein